MNARKAVVLTLMAFAGVITLVFLVAYSHQPAAAAALHRRTRRVEFQRDQRSELAKGGYLVDRASAERMYGHHIPESRSI
mmetsp:Transcript_11889/g.31958  ORF Transcript_11889/g.31958 Transcript_11889/m.31958 type:complete len:80 (+) Transcript_11889:90-329(+)|eukprot:CAMPEP_0185165258 /NCGR_PEP_ID=MMETSP1139-20130426/10639_1 /TAXON_ID=298111 /ORGANISM="Pavlova sp., Strain CCMP459" /LENGTH=79 /DNA_ID=CAMNT_0027730655 /DNA_START=52 /DNA_END=291 /DNA_ORIENTATION=-